MASYNYMIKGILSKQKCTASITGKLHRWKPLGSIRGMPGESYGIDFCCETCNKRVTEFYRSSDPVFLLLQKEMENEEE